MTRHRFQRSTLFSLLLLAALLAVPVAATWRQVQQDRLNHALIIAAIQNDAFRVRSLLQHGASPNAYMSYDGRSVWRRTMDLLQNRPLPSYYSDSTPVLMLVMDLGRYDDSYYPVIVALLDAGAAPNTDNGGFTPLTWAIGRRQRKTLQALFRHHVDVNLPDKTGCTPLMRAAWHSDPEMVEVLLHHGAKINIKDGDGCTELWYAIRSGQLVNASDVNISDESICATVACLLRNGASVQGRDSVGMTLLQRAKEWDHDPQLIQLLKHAGAK
jgi:ankyrin repeat protein